MNINTILDILLNQRLGLNEYKLDYLYPEIFTNLKTNTLPIFSQFFPCYRRYDFNPGNNKTDTENEYYLKIPEIEENKLEIISISTVIPKSNIESISFFDGYRPLNVTIEDVLINSMASNIASLSNYSYRRFRYISPNRVLLRGYGTQDLTAVLKIKYPSFSAIADSVISQFLDLAEQDIKIFIYNKLKHYDQLPLPIGNIDLKLDNLSDGISKREEIIDRFNTKGYPNKSMNRYHTYE